MIIQKLRRSGNSLVVTVPKEEVERLGLEAGDQVSVEIYPVEVRPVLPPEVRTAFEESWRRNEAGYRYLADR